MKCMLIIVLSLNQDILLETKCRIERNSRKKCSFYYLFVRISFTTDKFRVAVLSLWAVAVCVSLHSQTDLCCDDANVAYMPFSCNSSSCVPYTMVDICSIQYERRYPPYVLPLVFCHGQERRFVSSFELSIGGEWSWGMFDRVLPDLTLSEQLFHSYYPMLKLLHQEEGSSACELMLEQWQLQWQHMYFPLRCYICQFITSLFLSTWQLITFRSAWRFIALQIRTFRSEQKRMCKPEVARWSFRECPLSTLLLRFQLASLADHCYHKRYYHE